MPGPLPESASARLNALLSGFEEMAKSQVGYPVNQDFDYSDLWPFLRYSANNVGDPFQGSNFRINTHEIEREVIATFADLMRLQQEQAWGYVTSGGTEGNMYGLYMGRELFPTGTVYFSQDTHYSVVKLLRVLNMRSIMLKSLDSGGNGLRGPPRDHPGQPGHPGHHRCQHRDHHERRGGRPRQDQGNPG